MTHVKGFLIAPKSKGKPPKEFENIDTFKPFLQGTHVSDMSGLFQSNDDFLLPLHKKFPIELKKKFGYRVVKRGSVLFPLSLPSGVLLFEIDLTNNRKHISAIRAVNQGRNLVYLTEFEEGRGFVEQLNTLKQDPAEIIETVHKYCKEHRDLEWLCQPIQEFLDTKPS